MIYIYLIDLQEIKFPFYYPNETTICENPILELDWTNKQATRYSTVRDKLQKFMIPGLLFGTFLCLSLSVRPLHALARGEQQNDCLVGLHGTALVSAADGMPSQTMTPVHDMLSQSSARKGPQLVAEKSMRDAD